jgi:hypothetical protein
LSKTGRGHSLLLSFAPGSCPSFHRLRRFCTCCGAARPKLLAKDLRTSFWSCAIPTRPWASHAMDGSRNEARSTRTRSVSEGTASDHSQDAPSWS